jgi:hypothetical protein
MKQDDTDLPKRVLVGVGIVPPHILDEVSLVDLQSHISGVNLPVDSVPLLEFGDSPEGNGAVVKIGIVGSGKRVMMDVVIRHLVENRQFDSVVRHLAEKNNTVPTVVVLSSESEGFSQRESLEGLKELSKQFQVAPELPLVKASSMSDFVRNKR